MWPLLVISGALVGVAVAQPPAHEALVDRPPTFAESQTVHGWLNPDQAILDAYPTRV